MLKPSRRRADEQALVGQWQLAHVVRPFAEIVVVEQILLHVRQVISRHGEVIFLQIFGNRSQRFRPGEIADDGDNHVFAMQIADEFEVFADGQKVTLFPAQIFTGKDFFQSREVTAPTAAAKPVPKPGPGWGA